MGLVPILPLSTDVPVVLQPGPAPLTHLGDSRVGPIWWQAHLDGVESFQDPPRCPEPLLLHQAHGDEDPAGGEQRRVPDL